MKIAMIQFHVSEDPKDNLNRATAKIRESYAEGAEIIVLPEIFICPYSNDAFVAHAEMIDGQRVQILKELSMACPVLIVAGSMPIRGGDQITNTSLVLLNGDIIARHDKVHLFDIHVPGGVRFCESDTLTPGNQISTFEYRGHIFGLAICYDIRFPELFRAMINQGAEAVIIPAAFNMTTGPAHWELLARSRAMDNQCFITVVSPARNEDASYVAYGHSVTVDPWGRILAEAGIAETIVYAELNFEVLEEVRKNMPLLKHRRRDLYGDV